MNPDNQYIQSLRQSRDGQYLEDLYDGKTGPGCPDKNGAPQYVEGGNKHTVTTEPIESDPINDFENTIRAKSKVINWTLGIIVGCLLLWFIIRMLRRLHPVADADSDHKMGADTIYNHTWARELDADMADGNYGEAAVLCYLYRLWQLNEAGFIEFSSAKTPGMFIDELREYIAKPRRIKPAAEAVEGEAAEASQTQLTPDAALLDDTRELTRQYLRSRYGHKAISRDEALKLRSVIGL